MSFKRQSSRTIKPASILRSDSLFSTGFVPTQFHAMSTLKRQSSITSNNNNPQVSRGPTFKKNEEVTFSRNNSKLVGRQNTPPIKPIFDKKRD